MQEWKEAILTHKKTIRFKKAQPVFSEGDPVEGIFFVYSGSVKVVKEWGAEKELILRFARSGEILGHRGLGGQPLYPVSAVALEETKVCFITNSFLEASLKTNPDLPIKLMHFYGAELQSAERRMRNLAHMEVKGRISDALLHIAGVYGIDSNKFINFIITRQDIASYSGTTYETVFKFLSELIKKRIIDVSGKQIRLNKPHELKKHIVNKP